MNRSENAWIDELREANCSMLVLIRNRTENTLFRTNFTLPSGMWRQWPAEAIEPGEETLFGCESYGIFTGTNGMVEYQAAQGHIPFVFSWEVPFLGENSTNYKCGPTFRIGKEDQLSTKAATVVFSIHDPFEGDYRVSAESTELVKKSPVVYETWKLELQKASRSILSSLTNSTKYTLVLKQSLVHNGIWRFPPPKEILPSSEHDFGAESHGVTGTSGEVLYEIVNKSEPDKVYGDIIFSWTVPLVGKNTFSSNFFSVVPQVDSEHAVVSLLLTSDETFLLEISDGGTTTSTASTNSTQPEQREFLFRKSTYQFEQDDNDEAFI